MGVRKTKDFIYNTEKNKFGNSKNYEIFSTEDTNNRFARVVKIYRYDGYAGGMVPTNDWRVDFGKGMGYTNSKVTDYNNAMKEAREFIMGGKK